MNLTTVPCNEETPIFAHDENGRYYQRTTSDTWVQVGALDDGPTDTPCTVSGLVEMAESFGTPPDHVAIIEKQATSFIVDYGYVEATEYNDAGGVVTERPLIPIATRIFSSVAKPASSVKLAITPEFKAAFPGVSDDLVAGYQLCAQTGVELLDSDLRRFLDWGRLCSNQLVGEFNHNGSKFSRKGAIERIKLAFVIGACPTVYSPQELIACHAVAKLSGLSVDDFCAGNMRFSSLRLLAKLIKRDSDDSCLDVWVWRDGKADLAADLISKLRAGTIALPGVRRSIEEHDAQLKAAALAGKTEDQKQTDASRERNRKINAVGEAVHEALDEFTKLGCDRSDFESLLRNKSIIPPRETITQLADRITPGEMKAIIQHLYMRSEADPSREAVLQALKETLSEILKASALKIAM